MDRLTNRTNTSAPIVQRASVRDTRTAIAAGNSMRRTSEPNRDIDRLMRGNRANFIR
jgi:hypothetical protein